MLIINYIQFTLKNPLSRLPQGGKAILSTLSPLGEGRKWGIHTRN